eukprot:gene11330-12516_t
MAYTSKGNILFEKSGQAPSPSKDFHQLLVTESEVLWRSWRISLRKDQIRIPPSQKRISLEDFRYDTVTHADISRIFGEAFLNYVQGIIYDDWLIRMPDKVIMNILHHLDLTDIIRMAQTCTALRKVCSRDELWKSIYAKYSGKMREEVQILAKDIGWRKTFFTNKLQLQKEVSRLRKSADKKRMEKELKMIHQSQF